MPRLKATLCTTIKHKHESGLGFYRIIYSILWRINRTNFNTKLNATTYKNIIIIKGKFKTCTNIQTKYKFGKLNVLY